MFRDQRRDAFLLHLFDSFRFQFELANFDLEFEMICAIILYFCSHKDIKENRELESWQNDSLPSG